MGGITARTAAISAALLALALGPAHAVADVPPPAAPALSAVQQEVAGVAQPTLGDIVPAAPSVPSQDPGTVREAPAPVAGGASVAPRSSAPAGDRPAPSGTNAARAVPVRAGPAPAAKARPTSTAAGRKAPRAPHANSTRSAPDSTAARQSSPRPTAPTNATAPVRDPAPGGVGTTAGPRAFAAPAGLLFAIALIVLFATLRPGCLVPMRSPAPGLRRLAFLSPGVPPG